MFTHLNDAGTAYMVDVTQKQPTVRSATAQGEVICSQAILEALISGTVPKGDVLACARIAGISAAKQVPQLLPLAHTIGVHGCEVNIAIENNRVALEATVRTADRTGVEMEALTAVTVTALTIIDMVKGVDRSAYIGKCGIVAKSGGRSGDWSRKL